MQAQQITNDVLAEKYAKNSETNEDEIFRRVARGVASVELINRTEWEETYYQNMKRGALGAGRIMSNAGTDIEATLINCFVQPVGDAIRGVDHNGIPAIYDALSEAAETMRRGGGVGYNFSRIRPKNALVKGTRSNASGPCSYMDVFDLSCKTVESAGARRGAQMGVLDISHPDILEFIRAKRTEKRWNNFNVSVLVTDEFMECKNADGFWELAHEARPSQKLQDEGTRQRSDGKWVYATVSALELWRVIMKSNYDYAEPGILFGSKINRDNNLRYVEVIDASNPCAEQGLPNYGCCDLGQILAQKFVLNPFTAKASFNESSFIKAATILVRFLDNVLDLTFWPLPQQKLEAMNKRRIGVGYTGIANVMAMLGIKYNSKEGCEFGAKVTQILRDATYMASVELAKERGPFPLFDADKYLEEGTFASRLPEHIKKEIRKHGIRNSHLLSLAPVGTLSLAFGDNCSNGIEPPFSLAYNRKKRMPDESYEIYPVLDHGFRLFLETMTDKPKAAALQDAVCSYKSEFKFGDTVFKVADVLPKSMVTAMEMTANEHMAMLEAVQPFIDAGISKTVNVPGDYPFDQFEAIYDTAWKSELKGVSTYRPNDILGSVLSLGAPVSVEVKKESTDVDPLKVMISKRPEGDVDSVTTKVRYSGSGGDQTLYLTVSFTKVGGVVDGQACLLERPLEVFINASPDDVPTEWVTAYSRNLSLLARSGLLAKALQDNRGVKSDKGRVRYGFYQKEDGSKVPRYHDSEVACVAFAVQEILKKRGFLSDCGSPVSAKEMLAATAGSCACVEVPLEAPMAVKATSSSSKLAGKKCSECGAHNLIKKDGCEFCTNCGHQGACG